MKCLFKLSLLDVPAARNSGIAVNAGGTTKNYISRIENDASDIRLSTLMRIINEGLGAKLELLVHT